MGYEAHFKRVHEEFGKPFSEAVRDLAEKGHSRAEIAKLFSMPYTASFRTYVNRISGVNWRINGAFLGQQNRILTKAHKERLSAQGRRVNDRHRVTVLGVTGNRKELATHFGMSYRTLTHRLAAKMSLEEALTKPVNRKGAVQ